jgi:glucuronate isomerase
VTDADLLFDAEPRAREVARALYQQVAGLPIISPHGHVDPWLLADDRSFPDPARLLIVPDHYINRMLYSQGVPLHRLGVRRLDGGVVETDGRAIWRTFVEHWHLLRATPSRLWMELTLSEIFGVTTPLRVETADKVYDHIASPSGSPSPASALAHSSSGSASRCSPRPSRHWTISPRTRSSRPTDGAALTAG